MANEYSRRSDDAQMALLTNKIENLCQDMGKMEQGLAKMADALAKLAVVEERQTQTILAQERAFKVLDQVIKRQEDYEEQCRQQEKELHASIATSAAALSARITELEKSEPIQQQTSKWVIGAVWGILGLLSMFIANRILEKVF